MSDVSDLVLDVIAELGPRYRAAPDSVRRTEIIKVYDGLLDIFYKGAPDKRAAYMKLFFNNACPYMTHEARRK